VIRKKDETGQDAQGRQSHGPRCLEVTRAAIPPGRDELQISNELAQGVLIQTRGPFGNFLQLPRLFRRSSARVPTTMVVHGIPGSYVLKEGDLISIGRRRDRRGYTVTPRSLRAWARSPRALRNSSEGHRSVPCGRGFNIW